jgi:hypothetical protein
MNLVRINHLQELLQRKDYQVKETLRLLQRKNLHLAPNLGNTTIIRVVFSIFIIYQLINIIIVGGEKLVVVVRRKRRWDSRNCRSTK